MTAVERKAADFVVDAALLADAFALSQDDIKARMRDGANSLAADRVRCQSAAFALP